MKFTKTLTIAAVAIVQAMILLTPAQGQHFPGDRPDYDRSYRQPDRDIDRIIWRAYREILQQDPDSEGLHYYSSRMRDYGWTEKEVRDDLWKSHEYGRHGTHMTRKEAERIVRRAYLDVLGREPDPNSRPWVDKVLYENWTEQYLVRELRNSDEYRHRGRMTQAEAERIVRDSYREVLGREPDPGSRGWVGKVLYDRWTKQDVVQALINSDEYRRRSPMKQEEAERIVRRAYLDVLGREPDPGSRGWVEKVLKDHWTADDVVRALRDSEEYRRRHR